MTIIDNNMKIKFEWYQTWSEEEIRWMNMKIKSHKFHYIDLDERINIVFGRTYNLKI